MSDYTPAPHEARARFISGSIDLIRRRDECTLAEAEETAIGEWERWIEWHNVRVRRGVIAEEPDWEYGATGFDPTQVVSLRESFEGAEDSQRYWVDVIGAPSVVMKRRPARKAGEWVPVKQKGAPDA